MSNQATRRPEQKVWVSGDRSFAFGLAGTESTIHLLRDGLEATSLAGDDATTIRAKLGTVFGTIFVAEYWRVRALLTADQQSDWSNIPIAEGLVGGIASDGTPHVFHVNQLGTVTDHFTRGFASAGSGGPFAEHALAVFRELRSQPLTLHQGRMLALRVIQDAVAIGGPTVAVGGEVQCATVDAGGVATLHPRDDAAIVDSVTQWRQVEGELFRLHAPPPPPLP